MEPNDPRYITGSLGRWLKLVEPKPTKKEELLKELEMLEGAVASVKKHLNTLE